MAIKILGNTIIDDDQNINSAGTAKFKVASANGVEVQTIGGNEGTKFPFVGKNTSGTTTFSVDGDGNVAANAFIGDGSNLTGISRITNNNQLTNGAGYITSADGGNAATLDGQQGSYYSNYNNLSNKPSIPTHTSHLTNNSGFLTSIPSTVVQYNAWGNVNISGIIQGKSFRCRAGENGAVKNTFNIEWSPGRNGRLWIGTTDVGQIYLSSDYRLKRNITPMSNGALDRIKMVNPVSYQWDDFERDGVELSTASEEINEGFIAHELQQIIPSAVDGEKDDPITIQSLKPDAIMAVAVKAIQELSAKNDALEARIAQLESN